MGYSESDLQLIKRLIKPDLAIKKIEKPSLDSIIVEFLEKYEVFVKPVTSNSNQNSFRDGAVAGAIGGIVGPDVAGDAFIISGQNKQTKIQEWTQWKQWALDHKDFEAFRNEMNSRIDEENKKITEYLESAEFKELADEILAQNKKMEEDSQKQDEKFGQILGVSFLVAFGLLFGLVAWYNREEINDSFNSKAIEGKYLSDLKETPLKEVRTG